MMGMIKELKSELSPSWTNRRKVIQWSLIMSAVFLFMLLSGSVWLSLLGKFNFYMFSFFTTFLISIFVLDIGVIGSYVFAAKWENDTFLNTLSGIIPKILKDSPELNDDSSTSNPEGG